MWDRTHIGYGVSNFYKKNEVKSLFSYPLVFNEERVVSVYTGSEDQIYKKIEDSMIKYKNNVEDKILNKKKRIPSVSHDAKI